jgi:ADP-heptose:LPS heptosyltransferase
VIRLRGNPTLRFVDRYAGIPAIALFGALRRRRKFLTAIGSIGLLKSAAIGDTVLMSAVIADLRRAFPDAALVLFSGESNYEMACLLEGLTNVFKVPTGNPLAALKVVRSVPVDVLLDFGQWSRTEALLSLSNRTAFTVGFRTSAQYRHYGYDIAVEHSSETHELENYRALVRTLGVEAESMPRLKAGEINPLAERSYVVCHLWPGGTARHLKEWPLRNWQRLFGELTRRELEVVLTGSLMDSSRNEELIAGLPADMLHVVHNIAGFDLGKTAAVLAGARLVVSVNTGIMHMAAALGCPVVGLHGPTSSKRWGPVGEKSIAVDSTLNGSGYLNLGWDYPKNPPACMDGVKLESVVDACDTLLSDSVEFSILQNRTIRAHRSGQND